MIEGRSNPDHLYFQDWFNDRTIINGYINKKTLKGMVGFYECNNTMMIDLNNINLDTDNIEIKNEYIKAMYRVIKDQNLHQRIQSK